MQTAEAGIIGHSIVFIQNLQADSGDGQARFGTQWIIDKAQTNGRLNQVPDRQGLVHG